MYIYFQQIICLLTLWIIYYDTLFLKHIYLFSVKANLHQLHLFENMVTLSFQWFIWTFIKLNISYCICFCPQIKYSIQLGQLTVPVIWVSVWAHFLARSARAKLGSAQLTKFKIWKSSAQLSSPFERGQLSSARSPAKNFRLVPPLAFRAY